MTRAGLLFWKETMKVRRLLLAVAAATMLPVETFGFGLILHYQGEEGDREAYFADIRTISNRTPPNQVLGPSEILEIDTTAVYENPGKPEFVHMKLQFECPSAFSMDKARLTLVASNKKVRAGDAVRFRIGPGSYKLRRSDLQSEPIAVSDWKTASTPMLSKAGAIACNHIEVDRALHAAIQGNDFDFEGFGKQLSQLGLPADSMLIGQVLPSEFLDFAWQFLWWERYFADERPDPSGKWARRLTKAEKEAALKKLEAIRKQAQPEIDAARKNLLEGIKKSQAAMASRADAGVSADGKKRPQIEANLLTLWKGRSEGEVVATMGNPEFDQAGGSRYLRYTKWWEQPGSTAYNVYGQPISSSMGGYASCFVEFTTRQGEDGEWRVADVLVRADEEGNVGAEGGKRMCQDLAAQATR